MEKIKNKLRFDKKHFENYLKSSIFLNIFIISFTIVYQLRPDLIGFGTAVGFLFLFVFFWDLVFIVLNNKFLNKLDKTGKMINHLTFLFLIYAIITAISLISIGFVGNLLGSAPNYRLMYHGLWIFAILIAYIDYKELKKEQSGTFIWTKEHSRREMTSNGVSLFLKILKTILFILGLLTFFFSGLIAFSLLTGGGPPVYGLLFNLFIGVFFAILILELPIVTVLLYKITYRKYKKLSIGLTITGISLTIIFTLPFLGTSLTIMEADTQFAEVFGEDWYKSHPEYSSKYFYNQRFSLIQAWFGDTEVDSDSWELDSDNEFIDGGDYRLYYDVYYPGKSADAYYGGHSTIIFIHGGAWVLGDKTLGAERLKRLAAQGYVCFSIEYRLLDVDTATLITEEAGYSVPLLSDIDATGFITPAHRLGDYTIEDMLIDIGDFTQFLEANEGKDKLYGADLDYVFFMGQSAGAHLAGVAGFGYNDDLLNNNWGFSSSLEIKGIILFYPPNSARRYFYEEHSWLYEAGFTKDKTPDEDPDFFDLYTPSKLIDKDDPLCLIFQGTADSMVPLINAIEIKQACKKKDIGCILVKGYFLGHAHDISVIFYTMTNYYLERFLFLINN